MAFRDRLIATIRAARAALESPGVLVVGSEVPNLLEHGAAATLVVSQDLGIGVPVDRHAALKQRLGDLHAFEPSADEPSVWTPRAPELLELNFVGMDPSQDPAEAYVFLTLLAPRPGMPDPLPRRAELAGLLRRFEASETEAP